MSERKPLTFHVPEPAVRPGGTPDFSDGPIPQAGSADRDFNRFVDLVVMSPMVGDKSG